MSYFQQLIARLRTSPSDFFKPIQRLGLILTGLSGLLLGLNAQFPGIDLPVFVPTIAKYAALAGAVIAGLARITTQNPGDIGSTTPSK
jgi:hypothetical protein